MPTRFLQTHQAIRDNVINKEMDTVIASDKTDTKTESQCSIKNQEPQDQRTSELVLSPESQKLEETQTEIEKAAEHVESYGPKVKRYLVSLDGSEESEWAFNNAMNNIDKERDLLYLLSITTKRINEEQACKKILLKFAQKTEKYNVKNYKMMLAISKDVASTICKEIKELRIDFLYIGHRRNATFLDRLFTSSTTDLCIAEALCSVVVTQSPVTVDIEESIEKEEEPNQEYREEIEKKLYMGEKNYTVQIFMES